jgi:hypothetical protein
MIKKIPLDPPLVKGEVFGRCARLIPLFEKEGSGEIFSRILR